VPSARPLPTITPAQTRLANSLAQLSVTKSHNEHNLEINVRDLAALEEQEIDLRKEVERVEGKREWVEEFRIWIEMLGRFLEEKVSSSRRHWSYVDI
jgi:GC-rich sequence DNA-binding factor